MDAVVGCRQTSLCVFLVVYMGLSIGDRVCVCVCGRGRGILQGRYTRTIVQTPYVMKDARPPSIRHIIANGPACSDSNPKP